ncbi:MAG TPA: aminoglycoside phosphotransferase family protein [Anaerolineales bacterium]|nr:aminoglycoside phosphotransferase family protein [Anaerolineales bacterium]
MNQEDILTGNAGVDGIQLLLNGQWSRRLLRREAQSMLRDDYRAGPFHLTRAKFKPGRKLSAYFTFPALDAAGKVSDSVHLAVTWQSTLDGANSPDGRDQLQEKANQAGLMPVQRELWKDLFDQGIKLQVWPFDPKFPHLVRLGSPAYAAGMLASLGITHDPKKSLVITPIRYRPGERHVLRYEIDSPETVAGGKQRLYAKLYSNPQDAARAFGVANRVVDWLESNNHGLQGIKPEAISQEDGVILYPHAPGIPLSRQLHRSRRWVATQLRTIGRALAVLHNGPETLQADLRQNNFSKEAKVVKRASEHIQVLLPETYQKIVEIIDRAEEHYYGLPQEKPTFTHADFKSDHLLSTPQGLTLIDFDTCTLADPALDIGKFLADLEWWFTLRGISGVREAQAELLKGYLEEGESDHTIRERLVRARLFHVLILAKITVRRVPIYKKDWSTRTEHMIEQAADVLHKAIELKPSKR